MNTEEIIKQARELELKKKIADNAGMAFTGTDYFGKPEFIGTEEQWTEFARIIVEKRYDRNTNYLTAEEELTLETMWESENY